MISKGRISIIVPVYKVEKEIYRCVDSILSQTYEDIEVILVDDGSPDNCPAICDEYARKDNRVLTIHKENGGLSDARNAGLLAANGEYVLYVDSDDYIEMDSCEKLIAFMDNDVDIVIGACKEIRNDSVLYQKHSSLKVGMKYTQKEYIKESVKSNEWFAPAWLNLYKKNFLIENNLFYKKGYFFEDIEMLPRLFLCAEIVVYSDVIFYNYIIRENSIMTSETSDDKRQMLVDIYASWYEQIKNIEDPDLKKAISCELIRFYMTSARKFNIIGWKVQGVDFLYALHNAQDAKEKIKVVFFTVFPMLYIRTMNRLVMKKMKKSHF